MMTKFEDALTDQPESQEDQQEEQPAEENSEEEVRPEDNQDDSQQEEESEQEESEEPEEEKKVPLKAMLAERDKRKEAEMELKILKQRYEQLPPEPQDDEDIDPNEAMRRDLSRKIYDMSVANAKLRWNDYDEKEAIFIEACQKDPTLGQKLDSAPDPAIFAYETAKELELQQKYGNKPTEWIEKIRQEERAKLEAEINGKKQNMEKAKAKQPSNLNDLRSAGGNASADYKPISFGDALPKTK